MTNKFAGWRVAIDMWNDIIMQNTLCERLSGINELTEKRALFSGQFFKRGL